LRITQFAGLNTVAGDFALKPNEAVIAHNIDFGRHVGSLTKRFGYDSLSYLAGQDSIIGLYGAYYSDGRQRLFMVSDSSGVGWGNVYASPMGKAYFTGTQTFKFWPDVYNNYTYVDSFFVAGDTVVVSYTSDGTAYIGEICSALAYAIDTTTALAGYLSGTAYPSYHLSGGGSAATMYYVTEEIEFLSASYTVDTAQTDSLTTDYSGRIWTHFAVLNKPSFAMYGDVVFAVNGSHKGIAYNGDICRSWPLNAPGEPTIVPLTDDGPLDGEYRYAFNYARGLAAADSEYRTAGTVTTPIRVIDGKVLLKDFQWVGEDTITTYVDTTTGYPDSIVLYIYRTRANPGRLDQRDSAFLVDTVFGTSASNLATKTFIDSVADEDLGAGISIWIDDYIGRDSTRLYDHRYGAPRFLTIPTTLDYTIATDTTVAAGIFHGIPDQIDTLGVQYICTFIDTVLGIESNSGPPLAILECDTCDKARSIRLSLPTPKSGDTGIVRNLYRAHILQVTRDSAFNLIDSLKKANQGDRAIFTKTPIDDGLPSGWVWRLTNDTVIVGNYYLVAQIGADSTAYTDSVRYDSLMNLGHLYAQSTPPPFLTKIFSHDGRMFGIAGSRLYMSRLDSASAWGALDFISLDEDDGDQGVNAWVTRGVIRYLKNHSSFNIYQGSDFDWSRMEVSNYLGDIAPYSHAAGPFGHYYLTNKGVVRESEGGNLERTQAIEIVSAQLDNFNNYDITELRDARGFYFDNKYMLCIGDTTYVFDEKAQAWSTWSMTFGDATLYGTEDDLNFIPGDSMYFIKAGESKLYRYGATERDNNVAIPMVWKSVPLLIDDPFYKEITSVGLAYTGTGQQGSGPYTSSAIDTVLIALYDEFYGGVADIGVHTNYTSYILFDSLYSMYEEASVRPHAPKRAYQLQLTTDVPTGSSHTVINAIDIWWNSLGRAVIK
jgi:hypothetical protein